MNNVCQKQLINTFVGVKVVFSKLFQWWRHNGIAYEIRVFRRPWSLDNLGTLLYNQSLSAKFLNGDVVEL